MTTPVERPDLPAPLDVLHQPFGEDVAWTRSNVGEAMPGVLTPLGWTVFGYGGELALRGGPYFAGIFSRRESLVPPRLEDRFLTTFYGRVAARADSFALIGDRMPGTSGTAVVDQILGFVPPGMVNQPDYRRAPIIAARFPYAFASTGRRVRRCQLEAEALWQEQIPRAPHLDHLGAVQMFASARTLFNRNIVIASAAVVCAITRCTSSSAGWWSAPASATSTPSWAGTAHTPRPRWWPTCGPRPEVDWT